MEGIHALAARSQIKLSLDRPANYKKADLTRFSIRLSKVGARLAA